MKRSVLAIGFIFIPQRLRFFYSSWIKLAHFLGLLVNLSSLTIVFCLVITPFGLIKRLFFGSPLQIRPDKDLDSYWVTRTEPIQSKERYHKRF